MAQASLTRSVARNTIVQVVGRAVSILLGLAVFFLIARHLGVEGYGYFTTVNAFLQFFGIVVDLGLYIYLAKTLGEPNVDEGRIVGNVFTLRLVSAFLIIGLAPFVALLFPYQPLVKAGVAAMSLSFFFVTMTQVLAGVFQKSFRMGRFIAGEVIGRIVLLGIIALATGLGVGLIGIIWTVVVASAVTFVFTTYWARKIVQFRLRIDWPVWRSILRTTWPIAASIAFNVVYFKADTIILSLLKSASDVGIYGAPYRVFEALISIPALFAGLLTPALSAAYLSDRARFGRILQRGFEVLIAAALPIVVGAQFVSREVMELIAKGFSASGPVLQILVFGTASIFIGYLFSNVIVVVNRQRTMMWVYFLLAVTSIVLYIPTIQRFSYFGAATVTVFIESTVAAAAAYVVLRTSRIRFTLARTVRTIFCGLIMAGAMVLGQGLPWIMNGALGAAIYGLALVSLRVVDRATLKEIFSRSS